MNTWADLPEQAQRDLQDWFYIRPQYVDDDDLESLANLYYAGKFHAWNCPTCGERVFWGSPDDWGNFQGVRQADFTSYPGSDTTSDWVRSRQCDHCRLHDVPQPPGSLQLVGIGGPDCWSD